jgi:hypothetical protein
MHLRREMSSFSNTKSGQTSVGKSELRNNMPQRLKPAIWKIALINMDSRPQGCRDTEASNSGTWSSWTLSFYQSTRRLDLRESSTPYVEDGRRRFDLNFQDARCLDFSFLPTNTLQVPLWISGSVLSSPRAWCNRRLKYPVVSATRFKATEPSYTLIRQQN